MERLDKFLCDSGVGTRSQVKAILKTGRVTVDGKPETWTIYTAGTSSAREMVHSI